MSAELRAALERFDARERTLEYWQERSGHRERLRHDLEKLHGRDYMVNTDARITGIVQEALRDFIKDAGLRALASTSIDGDWTALANDIRIVDGNHDLGSGELAERLVQRGWRRSIDGVSGTGLEDPGLAAIAGHECAGCRRSKSRRAALAKDAP